MKALGLTAVQVPVHLTPPSAQRIPVPCAPFLPLHARAARNFSTFNQPASQLTDALALSVTGVRTVEPPRAVPLPVYLGRRCGRGAFPGAL